MIITFREFCNSDVQVSGVLCYKPIPVINKHDVYFSIVSVLRQSLYSFTMACTSLLWSEEILTHDEMLAE